MAKILYTVAKLKGGELIKAIDANKGEEFFCPICNTTLLLRKSGNTGKNSKRPHFAHKTLTPNCTPETALHYYFKTLLVEKIQHHLSKSQPLDITWLCVYCNEKHKGNLLKKTISVKMEHDLGVSRPDIALLDQDEKVVAAIEIVVTHKPEKSVFEFYKNNNIALVQINLKSDEDIFEIDKKIAYPSLVPLCVNPKCLECGELTKKKYLIIIDGNCWNCGETMKVATIKHGRGGMNIDANDFTAEEIDTSISKGVNIKTQYSKTMESSYPANTCNFCDNFAGNWFLSEEFYMPHRCGELNGEVHEVGYACEDCFDKRMRAKQEKSDEEFYLKTYGPDWRRIVNLKD